MSDAVQIALITALFAGLPAILVALGTLLSVLRAKHKIEELHLLVNSRLTQLLELTAQASRAQGLKDATDAGRAVPLVAVPAGSDPAVRLGDILVVAVPPLVAVAPPADPYRGVTP